jgi:photosystem II stability/assembly factor-like uncharacterized protein
MSPRVHIQPAWLVVAVRSVPNMGTASSLPVKAKRPRLVAAIRMAVASLAIVGSSLGHSVCASTPEDLVTHLLVVDRDTAWVAQAQPATLRCSRDRGRTWTTALIGVGSGFVGVAFSSEGSRQVLRAVEREGTIWGSEDAGVHWDQLSRVSHPVNAVGWSAAGVGLAVGFDGRVSRSTDGGRTWNARPTPTTESLQAVACVGEGALAAGSNGTVLRSHDAGVTWERIAVPSKEPLLSLAVTGKVAWIGGRQGTLLRSEDGGGAWATCANPSREAIRAVAIVDGRVAIAAADGMWIGGDSRWRRLAAGTRREWSAVARVDDQSLLAGATGGYLELLPVADAGSSS